MPVPQQRMSITDLDSVMDSAYGAPTYTGKLVSQTTALRVSAVWACISAIADDLARLPLETFRRDNGRQKAQDHYLWNLLELEANAQMTAFRFRQLMVTWVLLWGNAYAELEMNGRGQIVGLWPWRPDRVDVWLSGDGQLFYRYKRNGNQPGPWLSHERVIHLRGLGVDGVMGLSPIDQHKQTIGLSMAVTEHGSRFFGNGARPLGVLEYPGKLGDKALDRLKASWMGEHGGLANSHRVAILEEGLKYTEVGMRMVDAQYLDTMNFTIEDIARIYKVPPHRIGHLLRATNNNIEHQGLEYVLYCLAPLAKNIEQEIEFSALSPRERSSVFIRHNFRDLIRGDMKAQAEFYAAMDTHGLMTANEMREELDMNPLPGKLSNAPWKQQGFMPVIDDKWNPEPAKPTATVPAGGKPNGKAIEVTQ